MNSEIVNILLEKCKAGDKEAMNKLFEIHKGILYKYSCKYFIKGYEREDLEQIGWIEFIKAVEKYEKESGIDFLAFLTILIRNKYLSILSRKENNINLSSLDKPIGEDISLKDNIKDSFSMEEDFERRELLENLEKALNSLSKEDKDFILFIMKKRGNMQKYYEENKKETTLNIVRHRKRKILRKLQNELSKKYFL